MAENLANLNYLNLEGSTILVIFQISRLGHERAFAIDMVVMAEKKNFKMLPETHKQTCQTKLEVGQTFIQFGLAAFDETFMCLFVMVNFILIINTCKRSQHGTNTFYFYGIDL